MTLISAVCASSLSWLSAPDASFFWGNPIFEKDNWEGFTKGFRIFLACLAVFTFQVWQGVVVGFQLAAGDRHIVIGGNPIYPRCPDMT